MTLKPLNYRLGKGVICDIQTEVIHYTEIYSHEDNDIQEKAKLLRSGTCHEGGISIVTVRVP